MKPLGLLEIDWKGLLCLVGLHKWGTSIRSHDSRLAYRRCLRCGKVGF